MGMQMMKPPWAFLSLGLLFVRGRAMLAIRLVIWFYSCITKIVEQSIVSIMPMIEELMNREGSPSCDCIRIIEMLAGQVVNHPKMTRTQGN